MKLQHIAVIFAIIVIPITLILSAYIGTQIDTASLQQSYNTKLMDATHDAVVAFELNTANNIYSANADSMRRDIQASINTFTTTLATNLGISSSNAQAIMPYIPAILITLYDGYYIYSPSEYTYKTKVKNEGNNKWEEDTQTGYTHILKPYIYYSKKYEDSDGDYIIVNYTLDNYVTLYGRIENTVISKSGYLSTNDTRDSIDGNGENLSETIKYKYEEQDKNEDGTPKVDAEGEAVMVTKIGQKNFPFVYKNSQKVYHIEGVPGKSGWYTLSDLTLNVHEYNNVKTEDLGHDKELDDSAIKYRDKSEKFMEYITEKKYRGNTKSISDIVKVDNKEILNPENENGVIVNDFENQESLFNQHKREVIKNSIQDNMNNAMAIYNENASSLGTSSYFSMPKLSDTDWEKIVTNVNMVTFMQGVVVGTKTYNDYAIITSTNNKQYIDPDSIYFIDNRKDDVINSVDKSYHTLEHIANASELDPNNYIGYKYGDFKKVKYEYVNQNMKEITKYYYRRQEYACYDCIVSTNEIGETRTKYEILKDPANEGLKKKYYTTLARERYNLDKPTSIFIDSK